MAPMVCERPGEPVRVARLSPALDYGGGKEGQQPVRHAHGARAWAAAAVGRAHGLVQVEVQDVEAKLAQLHLAQELAFMLAPSP